MSQGTCRALYGCRQLSAALSPGHQAFKGKGADFVRRHPFFWWKRKRTLISETKKKRNLTVLSDYFSLCILPDAWYTRPLSEQASQLICSDNQPGGRLDSLFLEKWKDCSLWRLFKWSVHIDLWTLATFSCICCCCRCTQPHYVGILYSCMLLIDWNQDGASPRLAERAQKLLAETVCLDVEDFGEAGSLLQGLKPKKAKKGSSNPRKAIAMNVFIICQRSFSCHF